MPFRRAVLILFLIILIPAGIFAQAGGSVSADKSEETNPSADGLSVSFDLRTGFNLIGFVPGVPAVIGVPISLSSDTVSIAPEFGFLYCFDVLTDLHNSFYIPVGLNIKYNPADVGLDLLYYPPVGGTNVNHMFSAAVSAEAELLASGNFSLLFELKFGQIFIFEPSGASAYIMLNTAFVPRYRL